MKKIPSDNDVWVEMNRTGGNKFARWDQIEQQRRKASREEARRSSRWAVNGDDDDDTPPRGQGGTY